MVIHAHHSQSPISGEMKRIMNINTDVAGILSDEIVEIEFYSFRAYRYVHTNGQFKISNKIVRKYYIPNIEHLGILNSLYCSIIIACLCIKYKPSHYIEEWKFPIGLQRLRNLFFSRTQLVIDIHGAAPEEYLYSNGTVNSQLERSEQYSVTIADTIICQSDEMKRHLIHKYGCNQDKICVYRCGVDTNIFKLSDIDRKLIRKQLGIEDGITLFVYSGGMHKWQKIGTTLRYFLNYHYQYPDSKMLVLTKDNDGLNQIIENEGLSDVTTEIIVRSLPYNQVSAYLNAADVSFLIRDNVIMNAVASPTKLAEYMVCGLPVISSSVAKKWVTPSGLPYIIDYENTSIEQLHTILLSVDRRSINKYSVDTLSLDIDKQNVKFYFNR